jgi:membrane-bound metal-dependent hydrolase YbcI (DUF457 family)
VIAIGSHILADILTTMGVDPWKGSLRSVAVKDTGNKL